MLRYWLVILVLILASNAFGQDVGFEEAIISALRQHPLVVAGREDVVMTESAGRETASALYPRVVMSESLYWTNEPGGGLFIGLNQGNPVAIPAGSKSDRKDFVTRLELLQPLYDSDLWFRRAQAQQAVAAIKAQTGYNTEQVVFAAFVAYLEVQNAEAAQRWAAVGRSEADEVLRLARERQAAGSGLKAESLRAEVRSLQAHQREVSANNELALAREKLAEAIGSEHPTVGITGSWPVERFLIELPASPAQRGDIKSLAVNLQQAETARELSRAAYLPKANLAADYSLHDEDPFGSADSSWSVRANLSWELFDGLRRNHGGERALAAKRATAARLREAERQAQLAIHSADLKSVEAEQLLASSRLAREQSEESYRLYRERYEAGISSLADLLAAQGELERSRFALVKAEGDWVKALGNRALQRGRFVETALAGKESLQ